MAIETGCAEGPVAEPEPYRDGIRAGLGDDAVGVSVAGEISGGDEACQVLDSHTIDVILLYLHMPGMSGATLFHVIATQWPVMASRVIVMSGDDEARARESWLTLNRLPMVPKPFQIKELLEAVERMLPRRAREANGH